MKNISKFQLIFLVVCVLIAGSAVAVLAFQKSLSSQQVKMTAWGTITPTQFSYLLFDDTNTKIADITYTQENADSMYENYLEALADGDAPDMLLLTQADLYRFQSKLFTIPYSAYTQRLYEDTFAPGASVFTTKDGVEAIPFSVDPLVMYWNRDIFNASAVPQVPAYWDQFYALASNLTKKDSAGNISQSGVALGSFNNVTHAKSILAALILQGGGTVTDDSTYQSTLANTFSKPVSPTASAIDFFTSFVDPTKSSYSWNGGLSDSEDDFVAGRLAVYIGLASDFNDIQTKNPNLNFDVALLPQARDTNPLTYGDFYGFAISKNSTHIAAALAAIEKLTDANQISRFSKNTGLPPVRNDLLAVKQTDAVGPIFYDSALWARTWLDPDSTRSDSIFSTMITSVTSGASLESDAISTADAELNGLFGQNN